jgi:hypothetical protein
MGEAIEGMKDVRIAVQHVRQERRRTAADQYRECQQLAEQFGFTLVRYSESHYRISKDGSFWDIHPGNLRIRRSTPQVPFIFGLNDEWTLRDVVQQVHNTLKAWREAKEVAQQKGAAGGTST